MTAIAIAAALTLSACGGGGGGSSSTGGTNTTTVGATPPPSSNNPPPSNSTNPPVVQPQVTKTYLVTGTMDSGVAQDLIAVDPENPTPTFKLADKGSYSGVVKFVAGNVDSLGKKTTDAHHRYVTYFKDGKIFKVSSESGAAITCGVSAHADHANPADSVLVYHFAGTDNVCSNLDAYTKNSSVDDQYKLVKLGMDPTQAPMDIKPVLMSIKDSSEGGKAVGWYAVDTSSSPAKLAHYSADFSTKIKDIASWVDVWARFDSSSADGDMFVVWDSPTPPRNLVLVRYDWKLQSLSTTPLHTFQGPPSFSSGLKPITASDGADLYFADFDAPQSGEWTTRVHRVKEDGSAVAEQIANIPGIITQLKISNSRVIVERLLMATVNAQPELFSISKTPNNGTPVKLVSLDTYFAPLNFFVQGDKVYYTKETVNPSNNKKIYYAGIIDADGSASSRKETFDAFWSGGAWMKTIDHGTNAFDLSKVFQTRGFIGTTVNTVSYDAYAYDAALGVNSLWMGNSGDLTVGHTGKYRNVWDFGDANVSYLWSAAGDTVDNYFVNASKLSSVVRLSNNIQ
jgi:hypothetical protein